jgi:hypothetical protein
MKSGLLVADQIGHRNIWRTFWRAFRPKKGMYVTYSSDLRLPISMRTPHNSLGSKCGTGKIPILGYFDIPYTYTLVFLALSHVIRTLSNTAHISFSIYQSPLQLSLKEL